jgi:hypothetical protein
VTVTEPPIHGHTKSGRPITDQDIESLAAEAEALTGQTAPISDGLSPLRSSAASLFVPRSSLGRTMSCSKMGAMNNPISVRSRFALVASVRGAMCELGGLPAGFVVHPVAAPSTASAA